MWARLRGITGEHQEPEPQEVQPVAQQPQRPFVLPLAALGPFLKHYLHCDTERDDDFREMLLAVRLMWVNRAYRENVITFVRVKCKLSVEHFIPRFADRLVDLEDLSSLWDSPSDLTGYLALRVNLTFAHAFDGVETSEAVATLLRGVHEKMHNRLTPSVALATVHTIAGSFKQVMADATTYDAHPVVTALIKAASGLGEDPLQFLAEYSQRTFERHPYHPYVPPYQDVSMWEQYTAIEEYAATHPSAACRDICLVNMLCCGASHSAEQPWLYPKIKMLTENGYLPKDPGDLAVHLFESGQLEAAAFIATKFCTLPLQTSLWRRVLETPAHRHCAKIFLEEGLPWKEDKPSNALYAMAKNYTSHPSMASRLPPAISTMKELLGKNRCYKSLHPTRAMNFISPRVKKIIRDKFRRQ
jgi:hypothetical protein